MGEGTTEVSLRRSPASWGCDRGAQHHVTRARLNAPPRRTGRSTTWPRSSSSAGCTSTSSRWALVYKHAPGRTVTEADNVLFTTLTMNTQARHLDVGAEPAPGVRERLVNSMMTLSIIVACPSRSSRRAPSWRTWGFEEVAFPHPMHHGTRLTASPRPDARPSQIPAGPGHHQGPPRGPNQDGTVVATCVRSALMQGAQEGPCMVTPTFTTGPAILLPGGPPPALRQAAERADAVILDLERRRGPDAKPAAREHIAAADRDPRHHGGARQRRRLAVLRGRPRRVRDTPFRTVMLAKAESAEQVRRVTDALPDARVIALCETAAGIVAASEIAEQSGVVADVGRGGPGGIPADAPAAAWAAPTGRAWPWPRAPRRRRPRAPTARPRSTPCTWTDIADTEGLAAEAEDAVVADSRPPRAPPRQVAAIREAQPTHRRGRGRRAPFAGGRGGARPRVPLRGPHDRRPPPRHAERTVAQARRADTLGTDEPGTETSCTETREN
ncbi:MaoC/PaaZ C-terminal domain-containing protein [Kocuria rhizophila]|nr:MaoC/PaaZ C-terminal domain-containing protein [Kocuria rhizophila]